MDIQRVNSFEEAFIFHRDQVRKGTSWYSIYEKLWLNEIIMGRCISEFMKYMENQKELALESILEEISKLTPKTFRDFSLDSFIVDIMERANNLSKEKSSALDYKNLDKLPEELRYSVLIADAKNTDCFLRLHNGIIKIEIFSLIRKDLSDKFNEFLLEFPKVEEKLTHLGDFNNVPVFDITLGTTKLLPQRSIPPTAPLIYKYYFVRS